ncbi:leucine--tRNA ligase [Candidatus Nanobsidianus stetteri]|uniref:Leucine--tRNA ligase n=1 Tax=Nanobsidianus stetteri TaxID=1294122 RepID=A0A2T9WMC8_NANST|nr:leucine--tRNA ligase [Candidatus Nanobsidianus stetteri]MCC5446984.1 leucine--tRNA ligase [Candidatus Nanobsidianus stetteri]
MNENNIEFFKEIEKKWQKIWDEKQIYYSNPDKGKPKFFVTFPYPYVSGFLHIGTALSLTRVDIIARYKRLKGYNVLFPQGFHLTGSPIVAKSWRLRNGDKKLIKELKDEGVSDEDIEKLKDPAGWALYFVEKAEEDIKNLGCSIDWRRKFYTTYLHPWYNKFIEWQYRKLKEKGLVITGKHPVVYDPVANIPVGDHDRPDEYAGIGPTEGYIILFRLKDENIILPAFTLRPETLYGVTNIWINPNRKYSIYLDKESGNKYILPDTIVVDEFNAQGYKLEKIKDIDVKELIGKECINPLTNEVVPILPAEFVDTKTGTGIVMSVPSHAPYDYIGLRDLLNTEYKEIAKKCLDNMKVLFKVPGYNIPAKEIVEKMKINNQKDVQKLEDATKEVYSLEYYNGVLTDIFGKYSGMKIYEAKDNIAKDFIDKNIAKIHYTLKPRFESRYGNQCIVKIIDNQWFLKYSDPEWKKLAHECVDNMNFYPENVRQDFHQKIDWLKDWACAHNKDELGTPLPWDKSWVIESLSDSTIYMAFYTIAHLIKNINPDKIEDDLFDYIFLNKGNEEEIIRKYGDIVKKMKEEFEYWYPVDLRSSGKDLIPNHLSFFIFHHVAIFDKKYWPRGIAINGYAVDALGRKMSKSLGNYISLKDALRKYSADILRFIIAMSANSSYDDAKIDLGKSEFVMKYLISFYNYSIENYNKHKEYEKSYIDLWFENKLNKLAKEIEDEYGKLNYMNVINKIFELDNSFEWYLKRASGKINGKIVNKYIEYKAIFLYPIVPHIISEIFEKIGLDPFNIRYPENLSYTDEYEKYEKYVKSVRDDLIKLKILMNNKIFNKVKIIIASKEKYELFNELRNNKNKIDEFLNNYPNYRDILSFVKKNIYILDEFLDREKEYELLNSAVDLFKSELNVKDIIIEYEEESEESKKNRAMPYKPAIVFLE